VDRSAVAATLQEITAGPVTVAAFDLDGTLTEGGSVFSWLRHVAGLRRSSGTALRLSPKLAWAALRGGSAADAVKEELFTRLLRGQSLEAVEVRSVEFAARHYRRELRPEVKALLDWHRRCGHRIVIVSASPELYVKAIGELLRVDGVLATRLEVDSAGRLTGRYDGQNCRGFEKYARLASWLRTTGLERPGGAQPTLVAYGNSRGDLRLLRAADLGVNCGQLGRFSRLRTYPSVAEVAELAGVSAPR